MRILNMTTFVSNLSSIAGRPSYFEMDIQERLLPGLKAALKYVLSVCFLNDSLGLTY